MSTKPFSFEEAQKPVDQAATAAQPKTFSFEEASGVKPKSRSIATVANDTVIEAANAAAGGVASIGNFIKPGNAASGWIDKNIIQAGEDAQSDAVKASKQKFRQEVESADGISGELGAVGKYIVQNPLLAAAQAAGSFAGPGLAVKGASGLGTMAKLAPKGIEYAGRAAGAMTGAAMAGGDAAGNAYDLSSKAGATEDQAVSAGRNASVIPAILGGLSGIVGAEGLIAGGKGFAGGTISKALKTGAVEASGEAVEEGVTQYEGQRAAMPYDKSIDPTKGVAAAAGMGAALGGITGAGASLLSGGQNQPADTGQAEREPTTSPGAAGPAQPGPTSPAAPVAPDWATSPGAAAPNPYGGIDFTREVDTSGLSLADPADTIASRLKPSEVMGLNPSAGALSREVAAFVDAQPFTEVTPIETRTGIGAQRRLGEQPIIDVDAREVIDPQQTIAARLAGPSQAAPLQQAIAQLPYNPATQGDSLADQAPQAIQAATQRTQAGAAQAEPTLTDGYGQAWDSLDTETRTSVARSAGARGVLARNVASKGWGDLSPNLRSSISTAIESARSVGAPAIQLGNQPQGASNVGNAAAPQAGSVPAAAGAPNALSQGERGTGLSGNGDGVGGRLDGAGQRIAGAGFGEAGVAPVAGRPGVAPTLTQGAAPILQNRNRSNPSSIAQMQGIAADPDYGRLGFSRDFANGAPVVAGGTVPADQVGRSDVAVASDGRRIPVQYAVVEASDVLASNQVDGTPNADYGNQSVTRIRAIAGNGRIAGLQRAYGMGTSDGYAGELLGDALHGVNPDVIRSMRQPVLVRVMPVDQVTQDIGDVSNTTGNLSLSPVEQANNDAQRVSLDALQFSEDGAITSDTVRQFVRAMPQAEQGGLIDTNGQPTKQAVDRINAAVFARAYGNDQLIRLFAQAQDPEARNVLSALAQVAPKMARLEGAGSLDIRDVVTQAAEIAVNARREGRPLANAASQIDMTADPMVGEVLKLFARNARTVRPVVDALGAAADFAYTEANKPAEDMFGAVPKATRSDVLGSLSPQNEQASQANLEQPARGKPVQVDAVKPGADAGAATDAAATQAGRPAEADREALTLEAQTEEDLRAKAEREDAATSQAAAEKAAEQERLRREAEARDNKARADATVDDFQLGQTAEQQMSGMDDLFGMSAPESEQAQPQSSRSANSDAQLADAIDSIGDSLKRSLADAAAKARATAEDWASRQYRKSGRSVTFEGDGPSRSESVSVDGANAARRDDVVRTSNALGDAAQSLVDSLDRKGARAFLSEMLSLHTGSDAAFESTLISRLGLDGVARKGAMTSTDATKAVLSAVKQYREAIRNADSAEGRPEWMDELFGGAQDAAPAAEPAGPAAPAQPKADGVGRAVAGGQEGVNGYFYKGGQFLPSTMAEPGKWKVDGKWVKSGRALIGPREYGYQPTPFSRSLFELAGVGAFTEVTWDGRLAIRDGVRTNQGEPVTGDMTIRPGVKGVLGKEELTLQEIVDAWNSGQRWFDVKPDAETATTQPDTPAAKPTKPTATIEDFGERLEGARKFLPPSLQEDIGDDQIASLPLSKVWPSDAHESIEDASGAALTFAARQEIPAKPRVAYKVRGWVEKVKTFRRIVRDFDGASIELMEKLAQRRGYDSLAPFFAKVKLLTQLPRDTWGRIEKVGEYPDARRGKTAEELRASGLESRPFDKDKLWLGGSLYRIDTGEPLTMDQQQDEAWVANPFSSVTIDGKTHSFDVGRIGPDEVQKVRELLGSDAPKKGGLTASDFEVRGSAKSGYRINRKGDSEYRALKTFTGEGAAKKALAWRDENVAELEAAWEAVKARDNVSKADVRRDENRERLGENRRDGRDVTPEMFEKALGFRGVQFGNWVAQGKGAKDRQGLLNEAYDAMLDLADVLGIPPRAVSLNGSLGLSLGARGAGKASAHFEPSNLVINLTKTRGAGTLAHEWFHALDNYFSRLRGGEVAFTGDQAEYRRSNYITYKPEAAWVKTMGTRFTLPLTSSQLRAKLQQLGGAQYDPSKTIEQNAKDAGWQRDPKHKEGVRPEVERAFVDLVRALNESPMAKRASAMDKAGSDGYWGRIIERGARSFENYVINKLAQRGWSNDFLANVRDWKEWEQIGKNSDRYPYLRPDEEAPIVAAFDALFDVVETRETEGGNVAMFSRADQAGIPARDSDAQLTAAQQITDTIAARWKNAPADIIVARNMQDASIPEAVRKHDAELKSQGATGEPRGFIYKGKVYLLSDQLKTTSDVIEVLFHESLGHYGLRGVFGDSLKSILQQVGSMRRADVVAKAREYGLFDAEKVGENASDRDVWASMTDKQRLDAAEEVLAEMSQTRPDLGFVKRAISAIRNWLRANVPGFQNLRMKDADIVQAYILPARGWVERGGVAASANRQVANEPGARYSAREQDLLFSGDEAPTSGRPGYETDLFGDPLPISAGRLAPARPARTEVRGDAQPTTGLSDTAAPEGSYRVRTIIGQEVSRKLGADTILTPEQAAQATAYLYRSAVERFDAIVTDKNGKPLAVVGSFKGALTQTSVYPGTIIAEAVRVPGAARIWFSHNHPSGKSALSDADKMLNHTLSSVFDGTSIEPMGTLAVTGKSFEHVSPDGRVTSGATPAPSASINVPVIERELDPGNKDADIILDSPAKAREHGSALYRDAGEPGLMILDAQHRVAAWVPVRGAMKGKLMGTGGLDAVYRAVSESNAGSVIIIHGGELDAGRGDGNVWSIAQNLGAALRGTDVRVLDIIDVNKPRSAAETGADLVAGSVFSRAQSATSLPPTIEVDGKTRPTTNSNGQPIAATEEGARNFWSWFGDSRVVDDQGRPLVVYHGTQAPADFDRFATLVGYFTESPDYAANWAGVRNSETGVADNSRVLPVYLNIAEPKDMTDGLDTFNPEVDPQAMFYDGIDPDTGERYHSAADAVADLKSAGHDGVVWRENADTRNWATFRPTQIKSAIGNNGNFDPTDDRINFSRTQGAKPAQPTAPASAWGDLKESAFDDVIFKMQDKMIDLKRVVESITKSVGAVADNVNAYLQEELFHGRAASRVAEFGNREMKPLMNQMRLAGLTLEDVEEFLHARHAKEANAVIAQRNPGDPGMQDGGSGMTNADADAYFAKLPASQRSKLEAIAKRVDAMIADTRKLYVQYGLEDQAVVDGWTGMFKNYIPLMRENKDGGMGIGQGFSVKGKEVKGRTGSKRKVVDIMANIAAQREKVIVRGEKNRVAQALVGLAWANPNKAFWEVRSQAPTERVYDDKLKKVVDRPDPMFKSRDNVVGAKVKDFKGNVTEQFVVFNEDDPRAMRMAAAMKNLDAGNLEGLLGVSAKITRYFSAINTQYNPVFGVVNLVRDVQGAMVNLAATPLAGQQAKIAKDTVSALAGIYGDIRKTRKGGMSTSKWAQLWEQMQEDGGTTGYRELFKTSADRGESLKAIINPDAWMDSKWGKVFTADGKLKVPMSVAKEKAGDLFNWLSDYNEAMENGVRLAAYKAALDNGMSRQQAASLSKNLTVNFNRKGQVGMQAGAVYAFFNAAMQGTARIGQTLFDMEGGDIKTLRLSGVGKKVVYGGVLLGVMQALALSAAGFDDEDPPEFLRERSLIIPTGGKTYISIPMPLGLHVIPGLGRHATEFALSGFSKPAERAVSVVGMFADAFNPIGNAGLSMQTIAPTALDPFVALSENRDWTGRPIARTSFNKAEPGHNQWKDTATGFSKTIAEAINWLSGGNEYVAGAFSPTPDQIDYLIAQVGGGVAREVSKVMQTGSSITSGEELPTYKMPLLGRFVGSANGQASQGSAFYANLNKLNALETEIKGLRKDGKYDEAAALVRERPESSLIAFANKAERDVQKLRRDKRELIASDADRDAVRAKEDQITAVMTRLNELTKKRTEATQ